MADTCIASYPQTRANTLLNCAKVAIVLVHRNTIFLPAQLVLGVNVRELIVCADARLDDCAQSVSANIVHIIRAGCAARRTLTPLKITLPPNIARAWGTADPMYQVDARNCGIAELRM